MNLLSQRDLKWANIKLGFSDSTIGLYGCTITCLAMIIGTTPDVVNDRLKAVNGFASGNLLIWSKIPEAFPGITINRVWSYINDDVLAHVPNVLVEVPAAPIGGNGSHWVVYIGDHKLNDPWTGTERPTSDFPNPTGYCTITGAWKSNANQVQPPTQPEVVINDQTKYDFGGTIGVQELGAVRSIINDTRKQLVDTQANLDSISKQLITCQNKPTPTPTTIYSNPKTYWGKFFESLAIKFG